jgi:hypothetical protein
LTYQTVVGLVGRAPASVLRAEAARTVEDAFAQVLIVLLTGPHPGSERPVSVRLRRNVTLTETGEGAVLLDETTGRYWQLNRSGSMILRTLLADGTPEQAAEAIVERYPTDRDRALADLVHRRADRPVRGPRVGGGRGGAGRGAAPARLLPPGDVGAAGRGWPLRTVRAPEAAVTAGTAAAGARRVPWWTEEAGDERADRDQSPGRTGGGVRLELPGHRA